MNIQKSTRVNKKYMVRTPKGKLIHFGAIVNGKPMGQFKDSTGLGLYSKYDHLDKKRRASYRARHKEIKLKNGKPAYLDKEQAAYYAWHLLW
jgi:hypothetical protein